MHTRLFSVLLLAAFLAGAAGCGRDHDRDEVTNPRDPATGGLTPPVPGAPEVRVGNRQAELSWELADSSHVDRVAYYRLYRSSGDGDPVAADTSRRSPAMLAGLVNGTAYAFSVAAVLDNGLEGRRSANVTGAPGVFGVQISGGRESTRAVNVVLALHAPAETGGVQLANDRAGLDTAPVQPFLPELSWQLSAEDGTKEVFARFTDRDGNPSVVVSDRIRLDTRAAIASVSFSPPLAIPGETIVFQLDADETQGTASVRLGASGRSLTLRDDGEGADQVASDGIYSLRYVVPADLALFDALVVGIFTDLAGNEAEDVPAPGRLTVRNDPPAVTLQPVVASGPAQLLLSWSQAPDPARFTAYRVLRAETAGVDTSRTRTQVREITSRTTTTHTDTNLDPNRTYYYRVQVVDPAGLSSYSNEQSARPDLGTPPDAVTLGTPTNVTENSVSLNWSRSQAPGFAQYRVWRGEQADLDRDPQRRQLTSISSVSTLTYDDRTELEEGRTYFYRVDVVGEQGQTAPGNVVSAVIPDPPPPAVTLNSPGSTGETAVLLNWGESAARDFARYDLRRSATAGVGPDAPLLVSLDEAEQTGHLDTGLVENTEYYYRLFVVDHGGHATGSNELKVTTANADPEAVTLSGPVEVSGSPTPTVSLAWSRSPAHDFEEYRLYRDTSPAVGENSTLVRTIAEADVLSFTDAGLTDNTRYYYRVFVRDDAGGKAGSNERAIVTENRAPKPVTLNVGTTTTTSIQLTWTQNTQPDFDEYVLMRGTTSTSFPFTVVSFSQKEQTSHTLYLAEGDTTRYFFKVVTWDQALESTARLSTDSNIVSARTAEE